MIQRFVLAANVAHGGQHCPTMIVSPRGQVLAEARQAPPRPWNAPSAWPTPGTPTCASSATTWSASPGTADPAWLWTSQPSFTFSLVWCRACVDLVVLRAPDWREDKGGCGTGRAVGLKRFSPSGYAAAVSAGSAASRDDMEVCGDATDLVLGQADVSLAGRGGGFGIRPRRGRRADGGQCSSGEYQ